MLSWSLVCPAGPSFVEPGVLSLLLGHSALTADSG